MENLSDQEVDSGDKEYMTDSRTENNQNLNSDCSSPVVIENMNRNQNFLNLENEALLDEIVNMLTTLERDPEVILLFGMSGVGKSSIINTIFRVLSGQDFGLTHHGAGITMCDTSDLGRYDNCGIDLSTIRDDSRRQKIGPILPKLPHFIDWCGFGDEDTPEIREILELLLGDTSKIFLLITKYDLVRHSSVHQSSESDYDSMTLEDFVLKEKEIAYQFNIIGALEAYRIRWASYSDNIKDTNEYIENNALRFVKRIIEHGVRRQETGQPVIGVLKTLELSIFRFSNQIKRFLHDMQLNIRPAVFLIAIVFVVVIAVLYKTTDSL